MIDLSFDEIAPVYERPVTAEVPPSYSQPVPVEIPSYTQPDPVITEPSYIPEAYSLPIELTPVETISFDETTENQNMILPFDSDTSSVNPSVPCSCYTGTAVVNPDGSCGCINIVPETDQPKGVPPINCYWGTPFQTSDGEWHCPDAPAQLNTMSTQDTTTPSLYNVTLTIQRDDGGAASGDPIVKGILEGLLTNANLGVTSIVVQGTSAVISVRTTSDPTTTANEILAKVRASGINASLGSSSGTNAVAQVNGDDQIFGFNKYLVYGAAAVAVLILLSGEK